MTRLVVAPQARSDLNGILEFLRHEAGELVALRYGHRFLVSLIRILDGRRDITARMFPRQ